MPHLVPQDPSTTRYKGSITRPYVGHITDDAICRTIHRAGVSVHLKPYNTIRSRLVHPKDKVSKDERAGVVYQIQCSDCDAAYVGETERSLHIHLTAQPQLLDPPVGHHLNHWNLPGANELTNADTYSLRKRSLFSTRWLIGSAGG